MEYSRNRKMKVMHNLVFILKMYICSCEYPNTASTLTRLTFNVHDVIDISTARCSWSFVTEPPQALISVVVARQDNGRFQPVIGTNSG